MLNRRKFAQQISLAVLLIAIAALWLGPYRDYCQGHHPENQYCAAYKMSVALGNFVDLHGSAITALATVAIALFTLTLWRSSEKMWTSTQQALRHAERTAERQLRAYAYLEVTGRPYPPPPKQPNRFSVSLVIKNGGSTWARNVRVKLVKCADPGIDDPWDAMGWDKIKPHPILIGPNQETSMQFGDLSGEQLREIIENKRRIFYLAWVTYENILAEPPVTRQTQLFRRFNADEEGGVSFSWMPTHNCADEDCEKQN